MEMAKVISHMVVKLPQLYLPTVTEDSGRFLARIRGSRAYPAHTKIQKLSRGHFLLRGGSRAGDTRV